jgi:hypothetical protein
MSDQFERDFDMNSRKVDHRPQQITHKQKIATTTGWRVVEDPNFQIIT